MWMEQAVVLINAVHRFFVKFMRNNTATVWVHIWDHHQAAKYKFLTQKANRSYARVQLVGKFVFLKVFIWQPDDDPRCAPKHVTVLQYINSCVGRKASIFINNDNVKQLDSNHSIESTLALKSGTLYIEATVA